MDDKIIEVKNARKVYRMGNEKILAVDDASFFINKGEFCCLLGTSGSGKSTLLNLMAGIEKLTNGDIFIKGKSIRTMSEKKLAKFRQNNLGFVFQSYNLMNSMTALENVEFPLVFKRVKPKKRQKAAREMLKLVGLSNRISHRPKEMSGGQQQRVGIARAFVAKPEIVFADEPTGNLDTKTSLEVMELIHDISKKNNQTIVMVTHDRRLTEFADRIIYILDGKIQNVEVQQGKTLEQIQGTINDEQNEGIRLERIPTKTQDAMSKTQEVDAKQEEISAKNQETMDEIQEVETKLEETTTKILEEMDEMHEVDTRLEEILTQLQDTINEENN